MPFLKTSLSVAIPLVVLFAVSPSRAVAQSAPCSWNGPLMPEPCNVGIGATSPTNPLTIFGSSSRSQLRISNQAGEGVLATVSMTPDNLGIAYDAEWNGAWIARNATSAWLWKGNGELSVFGSAGSAAGASITPKRHLGINLTTGASTFFGNVGIGTGAGYRLNVAGPATRSQFRVANDRDEGIVSVLSIGPDSVGVGFDVDWDGSWVARHATSAWFWKAAGQLSIYGAAGNAPGTPNVDAKKYFELNLSDGAAKFVGSLTVGDGAGGVRTGIVRGKSGLYFGSNDGYAASAFFGIQRSPTGHPNDFAIVGSSDPGTARQLLIGYNVADDPSKEFHAKATINTFTGDATFAGTVLAANIEATYQDIAEWVPATETLAPGTVVVLSRGRSNEVTPSDTPYDTRVAGVVSAQPGVILGIPGADKAKVATTGRVKVRVDATAAPIAIGDLLVTSAVTGRAMKSAPVNLGEVAMHRPGTIIGKALEPLDGGEGEILVLLSMQ